MKNIKCIAVWSIKIKKYKIKLCNSEFFIYIIYAHTPTIEPRGNPISGIGISTLLHTPRIIKGIKTSFLLVKIFCSRVRSMHAAIIKYSIEICINFAKKASSNGIMLSTFHSCILLRMNYYSLQ